ncbi:MAG: polyisoprenoid-binding protein [Rhodospirillales bacterium]|nr:polyisoprenoid-binding protein [Rhodospirillales bacterium]MCB9996161.1 polyisoprenoid-binding protein [Rhodospirillales bacterium]
MNRLFSFVFGLALLTGIATAQAEPVKYEFDKAHTQVLFFSDHLGFSKSQGEFHEYDGYFTFDEANPANSMIDVTIKTASIDMDMEKWDDHMKNKDFFNVEEYPDMTFKSTKIDVTGEHTADITGDFTMLGQTHPVVLHVMHNKSGKHPMNGKTVAGFSATASLDRTQWGMTYGTPMMDPNIEIRLEVEASPAEAAPEGDE